MGLNQYAYLKTPESGDEGESAKFTWRKHSKLQTFMEALYVERTGLSATDLNCGSNMRMSYAHNPQLCSI